MASLGDAPTMENLSTLLLTSGNTGTPEKVATQDLVLIYDSSERKIKTVSVSILAASLNISTTDTA